MPQLVDADPHSVMYHDHTTSRPAARSRSEILPTPATRARLLRDRAEQLRQLATSIEQSLVVRFGPTIGADPDVPGWGGTRARLCERMLERNLVQLHGAADDLRETAWRFHRRADVLERLVARQGTA